MLTGGRRTCTAWVVALAAAAQAVESCLLESMYYALALALALTPAQLGALSVARGLTQALASPVAGLLGDAWHRGRIIAAGTLAWAGASLAFGLCVDYPQALAFAALSGAGLALVMPCVTAIVADLYPEKRRGVAFGWVLCAAAAATVLALSFDINLSPVRTASIEGWRLCYFVAAALGLASAAASAAGIWEPRRAPGGAGAAAAAGAGAARAGAGARLAAAGGRAAGAVLAVLRTPTFLVILVENISNLMRATGGYQVLYMISLGFSPASTASVAIASTVGSALGFIAGGWVGDATARRWPDLARPLANQVSLALTMPLVALVMKGMPVSAARTTGWPGSADDWAWAYGLLLFTISVLGSWCYANNLAMYAQVVPSRLRTTAYSLDTCIAGILSVASTPLGCLRLGPACAGHTDGGLHRGARLNMQGWACWAQRAGYQALDLYGLTSAAQWAAAAAASVRNAAALETAMLRVILGATGIKLVYTNLYWTLPRDRLEGAPRAAAAPDLTTPSLTPFLGGAAPAASERAEAAAPLMEAGPLELASMERQAAGGNPPV